MNDPTNKMRMLKLALGASVAVLLLAGCVAPPRGSLSVEVVQPAYRTYSADPIYQPYYNAPTYPNVYPNTYPNVYPYAYPYSYPAPYYQPAYPVYRNRAPAAQVVPVAPGTVAPMRRYGPRARAVPHVRRPDVRSPRPAVGGTAVQPAPRAPARVEKKPFEGS